VEAISLRSILGLAYLIVFGSLVGFTGVWLAAAGEHACAGFDLRVREPGGGGVAGLAARR